MIIRYDEFVNEKINLDFLFKKTPGDFGIKDYVLNSDGSYDINESVNLSYEFKQFILNIKKIPFKINRVESKFKIIFTNLTTLKNGPVFVQDSFILNFNLLKSLEYSPKEVGKDFKCHNNLLTNLNGCTQKINRDFDCSNNNITSLDGGPKYVKGVYRAFQKNNSLYFLKYGLDLYPVCLIDKCIDITENESSVFYTHIFNDVCEMIKSNKDLFEPLLDNKIAFHQMIMRLDSSLEKHYTNIPKPTKKSKLLL